MQPLPTLTCQSHARHTVTVNLFSVEDGRYHVTGIPVLLRPAFMTDYRGPTLVHEPVIMPHGHPCSRLLWTVQGLSRIILPHITTPRNPIALTVL